MPKSPNAIDMTDRWLQRLPVPEQRTEYWDKKISGLGLRVSTTGHKSWILVYRFQGTRRRKTLGSYPVITLADARELARETLLQAARGNDPDGTAKDGGNTFEWLANQYLEKYAKPQKRSWDEDLKIIRHDLLPRWGERPATEVKRKDVIELLEAIKERGAPIMANRTLACIRKLYNWAISQDLLEANPCNQVKPVARENQSDRVLSEGEIRAVWHALAEVPQVPAAQYQLLLLTAQRSGEVTTMRWEDVDLVTGWWTIPAARAKNKLSHRVPLTKPAIAILEALPKTSPWVFPSPKQGREEEPWEDTRQALAVIREKSGVAFVRHDLRRTAASHMASIGVPRLVISKVLNHVEQGVTRVYDRHSYDREKREALDAWAERLMAVVQ